MTKVELTRFRIRKGKEAKAQEWMDFLNEHHTDTVATMTGEKMYVESVFKEKNPDGYTYFYWYSVQGEGGNAVEESKSYIDKKHIEYWKKCIDPSYQPEDLLPEVIMIPHGIKKIME